MSKSINFLTSYIRYPLTMLQSSLNNGSPTTCAAFIALAALGGFALYRALNSPSSSHLKDRVVVTPYAGNEVSIHNPTEEERRKLYDQAKKMMASLPQEFRAKVSFNDRHLEISFKYGKTTVSKLANHEKLWFIFSEQDAFQPFARETIFDFPSRFCIKDLQAASRQLQDEQGAFKKKAIYFFKNAARLKAVPEFEGRYFSNYDDLLSAIFEQSKGLSFGDTHRSIALKSFLVSHMPTLIHCNVEVLFMEGMGEDLQGDLDAYFDPKIDAEALPLSIKYTYGHLDEMLRSKQGYTCIDIIKAAKIAGIKRIVGIDTELSPVDDYRVCTMNYHAKQVIEKEMPKGNYVIFSGADHALPSEDVDVPSFSQLFGIPSIFVIDGHCSRIIETQKLGTSVTFIDKGVKKLYPHFTIYTSSDESRKK
jgi:hypothetical protein